MCYGGSPDRRGHRPESGCRFDLSWVRFPLLPPFSMLHWFAMLPTKFLWPSRESFVNEKFRRADTTWCPAAKAGPRSCRHVIHARVSSTRPGVITSFGTRSIPWEQSWPTLVSRNSSSGYISSRIWLSSAVSAVGHGGQGNTDRPNPHDISPSQRPFSKFGNSKLECGSVSYSGPRLTGYKHSKCARGPGTDAAAKCNCSRAV
jgi:hypothetical protein